MQADSNTLDGIAYGIVDTLYGKALAAFTAELVARPEVDRPAYEAAFRQAFTPWYYEAWRLWRRHRGYA